MKNTEHTTLKQASQRFFAEQQLPEASLDRFEKMLPAADASEPVSPSRLETDSPTLQQAASNRLKPAALTASIAAAVIVGSIWFVPSLSPTDQQLLSLSSPVKSTDQSQQQMIAAIADEVTKNHIKLKPLEVTSQDFDTVRDYFTQLDFSPQVSRYFPKISSTTLTMAGGRYCSIRSETAAQLRYLSSPQTSLTEPSSTKQWSTLYQTQYNANTFGALPRVEQGQAPIKTYSRGLKVSIWVERQLLMVSVEDAH